MEISYSKIDYQDKGDHFEILIHFQINYWSVIEIVYHSDLIAKARTELIEKYNVKEDYYIGKWNYIQLAETSQNPSYVIRQLAFKKTEDDKFRERMEFLIKQMTV